MKKNDGHHFREYTDNYTRKVWGNIKMAAIIGGILILLAVLSGRAQPLSKEQIADRSAAAKLLAFGYQTGVEGWVIKNGDTLSLGKGSLPNKEFAFLYENPGSFGATMTADYRIIRKYLPSSYTGRKVILKDMGVTGSKKIGFGAYAIAGVGNIVRYYVELDNAIEAGEILPPPQFRKSTASASAQTGSVADELLKLKQLLDAGVLTKAEYDAQKKKLLSQ